MAKIWRNLNRNKTMLRIAAHCGSFIVFDTETTGLEETAEIIEFAACKLQYTGGRFCIYESLHLFIKPKQPVPESAIAVHGITNEFLEDKMTVEQAFPYIYEFLGEKPVLGAYNSGFDVGKLTNLYRICGKELQVGLEIDLLQIARDVFCEVKLPDHKLCTIAEHYKVTSGIRFHGAMDDVVVSIRVLNAMIQDIQENEAVGKLHRLRVYKLNYYKGFRGNSRLYVITSGGSIYYDLRNDVWGSQETKTKPKLDLETIDMEDLERQVFALAGCSDYSGLRKAAPRFVERKE